MSSPLSGLEPALLWRHFDAIRSIPRPSGEEQRIVDHVKTWAHDHGWSYRVDQVGNLCVVVPATAGLDQTAPVALQAHLDMVCEKTAGSSFDFGNSPIPVVVDGDWVKSTGTTLGADNGIGVAAAMAVADDPEAVHGPLELLFTVDEEATMSGASRLDPNILTARRMINLDAEDDTALVVGCAGGCDTEIEYGARREHPPAGYVPVRVRVSGLRGGHSGLTIHENRGNAIKILGRVLRRILARSDIYVWSIEGGNKANAIARDASALTYIPDKHVDRMQAIADDVRADCNAEIGDVDPDLAIAVELAEPQEVPPFDCSSTRRLVRLINALPHGVISMSNDIPGMVQTSTNVATIRTDIDRVTIVTSSRSLLTSGLRVILDQVDAVSRLAGASTSEMGMYPPWRANLSSPLLAVAKAAYRQVHGSDPKMIFVHAGLECGLINEKIPALDIISIGPRIEGVHAPRERVDVPSVMRFYTTLLALLRRVDVPA